MSAKFIKHIIWDDLATSGWKHLFPMQSNLKKFEEIWRFILLIRSLFRRCARRQNLNVVVWVLVCLFGCFGGERAISVCYKSKVKNAYAIPKRLKSERGAAKYKNI